MKYKDLPPQPEDSTLFEVQGAGFISINNEPTAICGSAAGFLFGVSWGSSAYTGGVLGMKEAKRLAEFIIQKLEGITETEAQIIKRRFREMQEEEQGNNIS